eukprot:403331353
MNLCFKYAPRILTLAMIPINVASAVKPSELRTNNHFQTARDKESSELHEVFHKIFNIVEHFFQVVHEKYQTYRLIINWTSKTYQQHISPSTYTKNDRIIQDYHAIENMMEQTIKVREQFDQFHLDLKVIEMKQLLDNTDKLQEFLKEKVYMMQLNKDLIYSEFKDVFRLQKGDISDFRDDSDFMYTYSQLQAMAQADQNNFNLQKISRLEYLVEKLYMHINIPMPMPKNNQ